MKYYQIPPVIAENVPPIAKLHQFWGCKPEKGGKNMNYWGCSKEEALSKAKQNNPTAKILWKKEL